MNVPKVAVIIPYYQREPGVLRRSLQSVLSQQLQARTSLDIFIVDDESPAPAEPELHDLKVPDHIALHVLRQKNRGPSGARNAALDMQSSDVAYVAFLDSDDQWSETHLADALLALGNDYDFYFADHLQLDAQISAFKRTGRIHTAQHKKIRQTDHLFAYHGDMARQIVLGNVIGTSTVVYRFDRLSHLRFDEGFRSAGEDYLFWLSVCAHTKRICFSMHTKCVYGKGVNIFSGGEWASDQTFQRLYYQLKYNKTLASRFRSDRELRKAVSLVIRRLRTEFAAQLLHRLKQGSLPASDHLVAQLRLDPASYGYLPWNAMRLTLRRLPQIQ